jgi:LacI family transcriptional regulator
MSITAVAKLAGVSHATVSRVINNRPTVAAKKVLAVRQAMERLNYKPAAIRPGRVPKPQPDVSAHRTGNIGVFIVGNGVQLSWLYDQLNHPLLNGVNEVTRAAKVNMFVDAVTSADHIPNSIGQRRVDGALVYAVGVPNPEFMSNIFGSLPMVWLIGCDDVLSPHDQVLADDKRIGELAALHLLEKGCRNLAFLNHNPNHSALRSRRRGFEDILYTRGISAQWFVSQTQDPDGLHMQGEREEKDCAALVEQLLASPVRPDGLFVPADRLTARVHRLLQARGVQPGRDILIVSVDNFAQHINHLHPRPASFDLNVREMGKVAAERLLWRISHPSAPPLRMLIAPRLMPGEESEETGIATETAGAKPA